MLFNFLLIFYEEKVELLWSLHHCRTRKLKVINTIHGILAYHDKVQLLTKGHHSESCSLELVSSLTFKVVIDNQFPLQTRVNYACSALVYFIKFWVLAIVLLFKGMAILILYILMLSDFKWNLCCIFNVVVYAVFHEYKNSLKNGLG
jgi:hypothetical protein